MAELNHNDAVQLYSGCMLEYKDKDIVFINRISGDFQATIKNLENGKSAIVPFKSVDFKPIGNRLGFVNSGFCAIFTFRRPVRRFSVGIAQCNLGLSYARNCAFSDDLQNVLSDLKNFRSTDYVHTIRGDYPAFEVAREWAIAAGGSVAFDRQFAIDCNGLIFYKDKFVGAATDNTVDGIKLEKEYKYLACILKGEHEKDLRDFRIK